MAMCVLIESLVLEMIHMIDPGTDSLPNELMSSARMGAGINQESGVSSGKVTPSVVNGNRSRRSMDRLKQLPSTLPVQKQT